MKVTGSCNLSKGEYWQQPILMPIFGLLAFLLLSALPGNAQDLSIEKIVVVEKGIYRAETVNQREMPGTTGIINTVQNAKLIVNTTNILARVGVRFGLRYLAVGPPNGRSVALRLMTYFPATGLRNPDTRQTFFHSEHNVIIQIGATRYREYHFEHDWEIVPGLWSFQFWSANRKLVEQRFCVYEPRKMENLSDLPEMTLCSTDLLG
jgi:hypothetical protein